MSLKDDSLRNDIVTTALDKLFDRFSSDIDADIQTYEVTPSYEKVYTSTEDDDCLEWSDMNEYFKIDIDLFVNREIELTSRELHEHLLEVIYEMNKLFFDEFDNDIGIKVNAEMKTDALHDDTVRGTAA